MPALKRSHPGQGCNALMNVVHYFESQRLQLEPYTSVMSLYFKVVVAPTALVLAGIISIEVNNANQ